MTKLGLGVTERSTLVLTLSFFDETGAAVIPNTIKWTLRNLAGIVNGRQDVPVSPPAATVTVVLAGADLAMSATEQSETFSFQVDATYDSTHGHDLPLRKTASFEVQR